MSRIEQLIGEIEDYIDSCKYQLASNSKIIVNKEEMEEFLVELRLRVPEEIKKYQKIISQQDAILNDAQAQANNIIAEARSQANELVSQDQIMQQAYEKANELLKQAQGQADGILNSAVSDANTIRTNAVQYTDDMLASLDTIVSNTMDGARNRFDSLMASLQNSQDIVMANRKELAKAFTPGSRPVSTPKQEPPVSQMPQEADSESMPQYKDSEGENQE